MPRTLKDPEEKVLPVENSSKPVYIPSPSRKRKKPRSQLALRMAGLRLSVFCRLRDIRRELHAAHQRKFRHVTVRNASLAYRLRVLLRRGAHLAGSTARALLGLILPFVLPALGCGILLFSAWAFSTYAIAIEVVVEGKVIGYVENSGTFSEINGQVQARVMAESEADTGEGVYTLENMPFLRYAVIEKDAFTKEEDIYNTLYTLASDYTRQSYGFFLDGTLIATSKKRDLLDQVLQTVLSAYAADGEAGTTEILNYMEIRRGEYPSGYEKSYTQLLSLFTSGPLLKEYVVQAGDTAETVAAQNGMDLPVLFLLNHLESDAVLTEGQVLRVGTPSCVLNVKNVWTSVSSETVPYQTEYLYTDTMYEGETAISRVGENGIYEVVTEICSVNGVITSRTELSRTLLREPVSRVILVGTKAIAPSGHFIWPTNGGYVSSEFGWRWLFGSRDFHTGMDIAVPYRTPIYAADAGTVIDTGENDRYLGVYVKIDHGNGIVTVYGHASGIASGIMVGKKVYQGQIIAYVGSTGVSTGNHVHFSVYDSNKKEYYDPSNYVKR